MTTDTRTQFFDVFQQTSIRRHETLDLMADGRSSKEIAAMLNITQSAVNKRIDALRAQCGNIPRSALGRHYRAYRSVHGKPDCDKIPKENLHLPNAFGWPEKGGKETAKLAPSFSDVLVVPADAPWKQSEASRVPEALDGEHASLSRIGVILGIATGLLVVGLVAFTAMAALSELLSS